MMRLMELAVRGVAEAAVVRVAALVTGGKDSTLSLHRAVGEGHHVACLVTMLPSREDSWMFHFPNIHLTGLLAEAVGIPLVRAETSGGPEEELRDLRALLATLDVEGVVHGAVASRYQKSRIDAVCRELSLEPIAPLWGEDPERLLREMIDLGFHAVIVGVYAYGLDRGWLGRRIDLAALRDLAELNRRHGISIVGEGGEYETLVLDAPLFKKRIRLLQTETVWEDHSGHLTVKKAELVDKA